jgi:DNA polymerase III alpha subunit
MINFDKCGIAYSSADELYDLLYTNPDLDIFNIYVTDPYKFNNAVKTLYPVFGELKLYNSGSVNLVEFDENQQLKWHMPESYQNLDIVKYLLDKCETQEELQRVGKELLLYQERNLFPLLKQLKYIIDVWRENNIIWGVGRGSSVASYVLYLLGVHKINSIYYELDIEEFMR